MELTSNQFFYVHILLGSFVLFYYTVKETKLSTNGEDSFFAKGPTFSLFISKWVKNDE